MKVWNYLGMYTYTQTVMLSHTKHTLHTCSGGSSSNAGSDNWEPLDGCLLTAATEGSSSFVESGSIVYTYTMTILIITL